MKIVNIILVMLVPVCVAHADAPLEGKYVISGPLDHNGSTFAYAHDSSWGGDLFVTNNNGETEYIYISQKDSELDSFLYDEENDYIGTSFDQLSAIFNAKKLHNNMQDIQDKKIHMQ